VDELFAIDANELIERDIRHSLEHTPGMSGVLFKTGQGRELV
jgi:hypothetical protein